MDTVQTQICIAGAGPAGLFTALFLEKYGIACTLVDKSFFPRDKICGDGISGWVVDVLEELDTDLLLRFHRQDFLLPSYGMRFSSPRGTVLDIPFLQERKIKEIPPGYIAPRKEFDNFFIEEIKNNAKYVQLLEGKEIVEVKEESDQMHIHCRDGLRIEAEVVVLAAGAMQPFQKVFSQYRADGSNTMLGLRTYYKGVKGLHPENYIELHFLKGLNPGYLWIFPQPDGRANVGVGVAKARVLKEKKSLKKILQEAIEQNAYLAKRFEDAEVVAPFGAHPLPLFYKKLPLSGNRFLLAGDSAGLIDPFTGEGIGHAALMGKFAAQTLQQAIRQHSFSAETLRQYDEQVYKTIDKELSISKKLPGILKHDWLFNLVADRVAGSPRLQDKLAKTLSNLDERKKLKNPWHYIKHIFR